jgi:outer membrane protein assembly complex protein YaeT
MRPILLALLLLSAAGIATPQQRPPLTIQAALQYEGLPVVSIAWQPANQPLTAAQLAKKLPFHPGSIFHEHELRQAIQNLFSTGRFSDLAVDAESTPGGVALRFITRRAYFVGHVAVYGIKAPPSSGEVASALKLRLGYPFARGDEAAAIQSLRQVLQRNGYYRAEIAAELHYEPETESANLIFDVKTGSRAHFAPPEIEGIPPSEAGHVIGVTHWKRLYGLLGWQPVTELRLREGIENIENYYEKRNYLESRVTLGGLRYLAETNRVQPVVNIQPGPHIVVRTTGFKIGSSTLRQLVPVFQEHSVDEDLLREGGHNIEQYLQVKGYLEAKATYSVDDAPHGKRVITYRIVRGPKHKFVHLAINGNHYFTPETIRGRLTIQPAQFPRYPYGKFSAAYLRQDTAAIASLFRANGFRDAKVTAKVEDDYHGVKNHVGVVISIEQGPQWLVSKLSIEGARPSDLPALHRMLASGPGQPFSDQSIAEDRDHLLNFYYNRGYVNATFAYYVSPAGKPARINLRYVLHTGPQKIVRNVVVSGLKTTKASVVDHRIELKKGQPLSLAEQTDSQRRLYDLGVFARVNTAIQNPQGDENQVNVLYDIDEAHHYALDFGVGAQIARIGGSVTSLDNPAGTTGFAPRISVGLSRLNFLGLAQTLGVQTSLSTIEQRAALTYFIPQFVYNDNLNLTGTVLVENSNDIRTFTAHRREASIQLGQAISRALTLQYRLVFRNVTLGNIKINQLLVPLLSQPETVGMGEFSIIDDKRDNPADAHRGSYTTLDLSYAPGVLGSQTHFGRLLARNSTYYPLFHDCVLARSTQFGIIVRTGGRPNIPLAERIYSGGSSSIRAFPDFQAGPRDLTTGFPLGGDALFINNIEFRFPLFGNNLQGVLFHDAGNVYSSIKDFSFRFRQRNLQDFNYMVQDVGFGIRYRTPVGPVRVDFSFSPNAPRFFGLKGTLQDYLNGTAVSTVQKINAFQFHISLGQAF